MSGRAPVWEARSYSSERVAGVKQPVLVRLAAWVAQVAEVRRQRRALLALDERMLKDCGLTPGDAYREAHRGILDIPPHKLR